MNEENQTESFYVNNEKSNFEKIRETISKSVTLKLLGIGIIILTMNIPLGMIQSLIWERQSRLSKVHREIKNSWGTDQTIKGLELTVPYTVVTTTTNEFTKKTTEYRTKEFAHFLPEELNIEGEIKDHSVHRGIYDVTVYNSKLNVSGTFPKIDFSKWQEDNWEIHWDQAFVSLGLSNTGSLEELIEIQWNDTSQMMQPGTENAGIIEKGISTPVHIDEDSNYQFSFNLQLKGSESLNFIPLGKETNIQLNSTWPNPKFIGQFSPINDKEKKIINEEGFDVSWKVLYLNRSYPQKYITVPSHVNSSSFGVSLFEPVDEYSKTERSTKYAMLFIALTFITFFFIQILNKVSIHAFQFIIVGLALSLFYILLISLSEHVGFDKAYLIAALGIILEIALYVKAIFKSNKLGFIMFGLLSVLYTFIFVIIQMESYSLLGGSIGLFVVLGILMYLSRNIDWKNIGSKKRRQIEETV